MIWPNSRSSSFDRSSRSLRQHEPHLDHEVAAAPVAGGRHAALAQPEPLTRLRAGRHAQARVAFERRHIELGAERRLVDRDRHHDVQIVTFATKERMRLDVHGDVEIAALLRRFGPACPLPGTRMRAPSAESRRHADGQRLGPHLHLLAAAAGHGVDSAVRVPPAGRAGPREHHVPARRLDGPGAVAVRAAALARLRSRPMP